MIDRKFWPDKIPSVKGKNLKKGETYWLTGNWYKGFGKKVRSKGKKIIKYYDGTIRTACLVEGEDAVGYYVFLHEEIFSEDPEIFKI